MDLSIFEHILKREPDSHKYDFGHVLVFGGSSGMMGAPMLSATAALRTGAGLVTVASDKGLTEKLEQRTNEVMTLGLDIGKTAFQDLQEFVVSRKVSVVVLGPGLKPIPSNLKLITQLIKYLSLPMIIDGGALKALADNLESLKASVSNHIILTPHLGEFKALINTQLPASRPELKPIATAFANEFGVDLVLKGQPTYIATPHGKIYENTTGNPGLATAGTGDVLTGVIAALRAQGVKGPAAAIAGVYLHGLAGDIAAGTKTQASLIASDVIEALPLAYKHILKEVGEGDSG